MDGGLLCALAAAKKHVVRFTLTEAAEEIKRLRRLERQLAAQVRQSEEEVQQRSQQIVTLKQELLVSERTRKDDTARLSSTYEAENKRLNTQLEETEAELRILQETSLPLVEARKLTFKALRKGRALQYMAQLYTNNTVLMAVKREALHKLLENAFGENHAAFRAAHGFACGVQSYTDSHLRLLRQEQLILLAENERLQTQIQDLQQWTESGRKDRILQQESILAGKEDYNWGPKQSRDSSGQLAGSRSMGPATWQREFIGSHESSVSLRGGGKTKGNEAELARAKLQCISRILAMARLRLLSYGIRRLYAYTLNESVAQNIQNTIKKTSMELRKEAITTGSALVMSFIRMSDKASLVRAFWILVLNSEIQNHAQEIQAKNEQLKEAQQQAARGGIPLPVAYAPHYFRDLPSAQKRRNMYFTTTPPRVPQGVHPSTVQRARDLALSQETFFRPASVAEGWKGTGTNGLGIGLEPVGSVVGSRAMPKETKLDAAKEILKGALGLPATTPASQPLTAAERNDAYMEQLLRATDQRLKLQ
ncbi:hypothetical protein cyc_05548 [Cyclospora cayetanensis]|uniref:Uncharacterized protein n=1 Tax=Cyclospora cayetanensis TaxID=88456 RepID=A0A1D3D8C7_9EIME|nr:hypothetical protein cyc_05548 [Cyclospora cayetanensis]